MDIAATFKAILSNAPAEASPRAPWPAGDPRKQTAIENACFEDDATIHFEKLAPLQGWAPLAGMNATQRASFIVTNTVKIALEARLKLSQPEIDAISETCAKNYRWGSWAPPTAMAIAAASTYHGRENFRFPFWTPPASWFNANSFPTQRWTLLRGASANYTWHFCRFMAYFPIAKIASSLFFSSIIRMSISSDVISDKRLSRISDVLRQKVMPNRRPVPQRAPQPQTGEREMAEQPIGQTDSELRDESYRRVGLAPPSTEELRQMSQQRRTSTISSTEQDARAPAESSGSWTNSELFEDDASPVSAAAVHAERERAAAQARVQSLGPPGASSWDRVRQQAKSDASAFAKGDRSGRETTWNQVQQGYAAAARDGGRTPAGESYSYSESDQAKNYAKTQAQNEFDALLEAERKGESENSKWK